MAQFLEWLKKLFNTDANTVATIVITLIVFFAGVFINELLNYIKASKQRGNTKKLMKFNYASLIRQLERQKATFEDISKKIKTDFTVINSYPYVHFAPVRIFKELGYQNSYNSLFKGFRNSMNFRKDRLFNFNLLLEYVEICDKLEGKNEQSFYEIFASLNKLKNEYDGAVERVSEHLNNLFPHFIMILEAGSKEENEWKDIFKIYGTTKDVDIKVKTAIKASEFIDNQIKHFLSFPNAMKMIDDTHKDIGLLIQNAKQLKLTVSMQSSRFKNQAETYKLWSNVLKENSKSIFGLNYDKLEK